MWISISVVILIFSIPVTPRAYKWNSRTPLKDKKLPGNDNTEHLYGQRKGIVSSYFPSTKTIESTDNKLNRYKRAVVDQIFPHFDETEEISKSKVFIEVPPKLIIPTKKPLAVHLPEEPIQNQSLPVITASEQPAPVQKLMSKKEFKEEVNRVFESNSDAQYTVPSEPQYIIPSPNSEKYGEYTPPLLEGRAGKGNPPEERIDYYGPRTINLTELEGVSKGEGDQFKEEKEEKDCYLPKDSSGKFQYEYLRIPPCKGLDQTPEGLEPIPYIYYNGTLGYGAECWLLGVINDGQLIGIPPEPVPNPIDGPLEEKRDLLEQGTCKVSDGLECVREPPETESETSTTLAPGSIAPIKRREINGKCRCMNSLGIPDRKRIVLREKCYIPAELGYHSECETPKPGENFPLPSGDPVYESDLWNKIILKCVPGARCAEHYNWYGKRCVCRKGFLKNRGEDESKHGTCVTPDGEVYEAEEVGVNLKPNMYTFIASLTITILIYLMK